MNHLWRRFLSILLCMSLCSSCFALPAGAADEQEEAGDGAVETFAEETATQETTAVTVPETTIAAEQETTIATEPEESEPAEIYVGTLTYWDQNMIVEVECTQEDNVPASAQIVFTKIDKRNEQFSGYWEQAEEFLAQNGCREMNFAQFWSIGLEADGIPVALSSELKITIKYVHYTDAVQKSGTEKLHLVSFPQNADLKLIDYTVIESAPDGSGGMLIRKISFTGHAGGTFGLAKTADQNKTVSAAAGNCTVEAEFGTDAQFPENVELEVSQVSVSTEAYDTYFAKTRNDLQSQVSGSLVYAQYFDVSFLLDGQELEPAAAVDMTLGFDEGIPMGQAQDLRVIHFLDDGTWELLPVTIVAQEAGENEGEIRVKAISFEQSSFSVIGIIVLDKGKTVNVRVDGERFTHVSESSEITVTKVWRDENGEREDADVHANDTVTVELCRVTEVNGQTQYETVQTGTLKASTIEAEDWTYTFRGVVGERSDIYAICETKVTSGDPEVAATYQSAIATTQTFSETWTQTDTLVDGGYYLIKTPLPSGQQWHLRAASSEDVLRNQSAPSNPYSILEGLGDIYTAYSIWQAIDNGDGSWSFYNSFGRKKYLALSGDLWTVSAVKSKEAGTDLIISDGYIYSTVNGEAKYLRFPLEDYHNGKFVAADQVNASKVMFYEYDCQIVTCNVTVTNTKNFSPKDHLPSVNADVSKRIDWLGDGVANPDTDADNQPQETRQDLYRLYLDYKPLNDATGLDLLLVLDASESMGNEDAVVVYEDGTTSKGRTRAEALYEALKAFIPSFLPDGTRNRLCIVVFDKDTAILHEWTSDRNTVLASIGDESYYIGSGTNYEGALIRAHEAFTYLGYSSNDKAMIFMSDGEPSMYVVGNDGEELGNVTMPMGNKYGFASGGPVSTLPTGWDALWSEDIATEYAGYASTSFQRYNPDVAIGTIAFNFKDGVPQILKDIATKPQFVWDLKADKGGTAGLVEAMNLIASITPTNVAVIDVLSEDVELHDDSDFKVTVTDTDGTEIVLYDNGKLTAQGKVVLDNNNPISIVGREVRMTFKADYKVVHENTYTLSFNVRPKQQAFDRYADADGTYLNTGSQNTDYSGNNSSSGREGYYANDETARVVWDFANVANEKSYSEFMPVIQVRDGSLTVQKIDVNTGAALSGVEFTLYRMAEDGSYIVVDAKETDSNGIVKFDHLRLAVFDTGYTYYLEETKPLAGYIPMEDIVELKLYQDGVVINTENELVKVLPNGVLQVGNEGFTTFAFTKVAAEDTTKVLKGAEFVIYRLVCTNTAHDHGTLLDPQNIGACWVEYDRQTTGEDGRISFILPINSTYRLIETKAPGGYSLPAGQWGISIGMDDAISFTAVASEGGKQPPAFAINGEGTYTVTNMKPMQIPTTGGLGTGLYHWIGLTAMVAGIWLVILSFKRRTNSYS